MDSGFDVLPVPWARAMISMGEECHLRLAHRARSIRPRSWAVSRFERRAAADRKLAALTKKRSPNPSNGDNRRNVIATVFRGVQKPLGS